MLSADTISRITRDAVAKQVAVADLERVRTETTADSDGNEAVRITIVLTAHGVKSLTGDQALDLLTEVQQRLQHEGDERFPIIEYATEQELELDEPVGDGDNDEDD